MKSIISYKRAFTLIELLVVIAIIAILAAILFPVFAQAKVAAKMAVSLSNLKQSSLAQFIYAGDFDDKMICETEWNTGSDPLWFGSTGTAFSPWSYIILPYIKTVSIYEDPLASPPVYPGTIWEVVSPQYGYDYNVMSPFMNGGPNPSSQSDLAKPANTVMLTAHANPMLCGPGPWNLWVYIGWGPTSMGGIEVPDCDPIPPACFRNWGVGDMSSWVNNDNRVEGAETGLVAGRGPNYNSVVVWADGHATKNPLSNLAAGTNWVFGQADSALTITDASKYQWEKSDCTTDGINNGSCF
jgi:prepilin-type N-terminal cleavage/methylation domain-containing protein